VVLVVLDAFGFAEEDALTYRAASLVLAELAVVVLGTQLPATAMVARVPPACLLIVVLWVVGLWLIGKA
jgi:cation:H+ antiporter